MLADISGIRVKEELIKRRVKEELIKLGAVISSINPGIFNWEKKNCLMAY